MPLVNISRKTLRFIKHHGHLLEDLPQFYLGNHWKLFCLCHLWNSASLVHPLEITQYITFLLLLQKISLSSPSLCLFSHLDITSESVKGQSWGINYLNMALSKLKTYDLNEKILKNLKTSKRNQKKKEPDFIECLIQQLSMLIHL